MTMGLVRGAAVLTFGNDYSRDSERLGILTSMEIWEIWKSNNERSTNDRVVAASEAKEELKGLIKDLARKAGTRRVSWKEVGGWNVKLLFGPSGRMSGSPCDGRGIDRRFLLTACGRLHRRGGVLVGRSGGRLSNGRIDQPVSRPGVLHTTPGGATVHDICISLLSPN